MNKSVLILPLIGITLFCIVFFTIQGCQKFDKKYSIRYNSGGYVFSDYTDTFKINNGYIEYIDENGNSVKRFGTYSIIENKK